MTHREAANELILEVAKLCNMEPHQMKALIVEPHSITLEHYELNEEGKKFIRDDGTVAMARRIIPFKFREPVTA